MPNRWQAIIWDNDNLDPDSLLRYHLTSIGNPIVEIRRSYDRLISPMVFPILVRHLYIESGPWFTDIYMPHQASMINTLRQNCHHFADKIFKYIYFNENVWISLKISLKFVPKFWINNISALVQIMASRLPGDKPLSESMLVSLLMYICVTRPQWVKHHARYPYSGIIKQSRLTDESGVLSLSEQGQLSLICMTNLSCTTTFLLKKCLPNFYLQIKT